MNLSRWMKAVVVGSLLSGAAMAQDVTGVCRSDQPYQTERVRTREPSSLSADQARDQPVVHPGDVVVEPATNPAAGYAISRREPPAGDRIKVRRSFQPELQASVLNE